MALELEGFEKRGGSAALIRELISSHAHRDKTGHVASRALSSDLGGSG